MPVEERVITFNLDEIHKAILISAIQKDMDEVPMGRLLSMNMEGDDDTIGVNIKTKEGEHKEFHYDRVFFAQALVLFCQGSGIPLPRQSQKVLKIMEDRIVLSMEINSTYND